jgi:hypothetical protein
MANTLRIKRRASGSSLAPASLSASELAMNEVNQILYYGLGDSSGTATSVVAVGGVGAFATLGTTQTISGAKTFSDTTTFNGSLAGTFITAVANGGSGVSSASQNTIFAAPNGSAGAPSFRSLVAADIPSLTSAKISDFDTSVRASRLDQMAAPTGSVSMNNQKITNLAAPVNAGDAVTKSYADALTSSLDIKASVKAATTGNITLSGTQTIDGVVLAAGQRVLVKDQTNATQNGIYEVAASTWSRATDADSSDEVTPGLFCFVEQGTTNADSGWVLISDGTITLGSSNIAFSQFSKTAEITAGDGLTRVGSTISAVGTASRVTVSGAGIDIASTYVGQATITTLGTITTGTWSGTAIGLTKGGTGADLSALSSGTLIKKAAGATLTSAVVDTDYLSPSSIIDGGTF